jgi:hypothetical protein
MAASLPNEPDDLLITDDLHHRIAHKADYQREKLAIQDLARQMAEQPDQVLPRLVHLAMELCGGQSAGISLYEAQPPGPGIFRWHHLAGRYANFSGGTVVCTENSDSHVVVMQSAEERMRRDATDLPLADAVIE